VGPEHTIILYAGKPYFRGRLSTVDLLAITSLDKLLFYIQKLDIKEAPLMRRSTVQSLPLI
jgi:hypothetical protein